jgi:hypothetical protein
LCLSVFGGPIPARKLELKRTASLRAEEEKAAKARQKAAQKEAERAEKARAKAEKQFAKDVKKEQERLERLAKQERKEQVFHSLFLRSVQC